MLTLLTDRLQVTDTCFLYPCLTYDAAGVDHVVVRDTRGSRMTLSATELGYADQAALIADLEAANVALCGAGSDDPLEYVGISTKDMCRTVDQKKVVIQFCKLQDGKVEMKDLDSGAVLADLSAYTLDCIATFEKCFSFTQTIQDGETTDLTAVLAAFGSGLGIAGFDFDLKPIGGDGRSGYVSTTSNATSAGPHGDRNLDGGGSHKIDPERLPDNTYNRLDLSQTFSVDAGSVALLSVSIIM